MIDDVDSFVTIARLLKERGAYKIYVMATHGLLSAEAPRLLEDSPIDEASVRRRHWKMQIHCIELEGNAKITGSRQN